MTDEVIELRERTGFPGMKILQFAFNPDDESIDSPHLAPNNSVMYTGTHDNNTVLGWYRNEIDDPTREYLARYTNRKEYESVPHAMLRTVFASVSFMAIATMQDLLELDGSARMNFPSTLGGNWSWRMTADQLTPAVEQELLDFTTIYRRENKDLKKKLRKQKIIFPPIKIVETKETPNMESLQKYVIDHHQKTIAECSNEELYIALLNYTKQASAQKKLNTGKKKFTTSQLSS